MAALGTTACGDREEAGDCGFMTDEATKGTRPQVEGAGRAGEPLFTLGANQAVRVVVETAAFDPSTVAALQASCDPCVDLRVVATVLNSTTEIDETGQAFVVPGASELGVLAGSTEVCADDKGETFVDAQLPLGSTGISSLRVCAFAKNGDKVPSSCSKLASVN
ncbi:hypothetical protein CO046_00025 [Candidatus Peregrinibacteria bacterium CG_4_9_14_0_2_um_filter_53_11]|nr:MAG: hypothetical protein CO046_00025 [Candidatus Peregrinibacteria bacterium CG_4_9_14_0_2_um_filter_53_11]